MLNISDLAASYGMHQALASVSLQVADNEIVVILGANGAGKSTLLKAIAGICEGHSSGDVTLDGRSLVGLDPEEIVECGIAFVPEGRGIFGDLSVQENLLLGAYAEHARDRQSENMDRVLQLFPKLAERKKQIARTMSGGEQQMVAIGRALMSAPSVLMLDEPSLGLSPLLCKELFSSLTQVRETGVGILLVEQNARQSLGIADRGYLLENGKIIGENSASQLLHDPAVQAAYLGGVVSKVAVSQRAVSQRPGSHRPVSQTASAKNTTNQPIAVTQSEQPTAVVTHALANATFTPRSESQGNSAAITVTADSLIGDDIDAMVARASSTAVQRAPAALTGKSVSSKLESVDSSSDTAKPLSATSPATTNLLPLVPTGGKLGGKHSSLPETQDEKVQQLLADFEAAAQAAASGSRQVKSRQVKSRHAKSRESDPLQDDSETLPLIPVYRKSTVTVYRRDMSGRLRKQERS